MSRDYCVYILANRSRNLYTGVASDLERRMIEHRDGLVAGFTTRYRIFRLVYFEVFADVTAAIAREKEIKGWRREKKIRLIERNNPTWADLAESLPTIYRAKERGGAKRRGAGAKAETESKA
ncbi:MAG: GIY-YIG nuclease family protein [Acidobacteria bacterium]|nr:GIY-YIG nuclease family protein [Acidobacteriota bacterium]